MNFHQGSVLRCSAILFVRFHFCGKFTCDINESRAIMNISFFRTIYVSGIFICLIFSCCLFSNESFAQKKSETYSVLVYTRNGKGYVHDNLQASAACVQSLGKKYGFEVIVSDTPIIFTKANLAKFRIIIFASTNNDVFDTDEQRLAFRNYIESGGGFIGIHSVMGTERNWTWFKNMLGGTFAWHPKNQVYQIRNIKPRHASVKEMPLVWGEKRRMLFQQGTLSGS